MLGGKGRGGEVQVSVVGGGKESRTFFIDQQNFLFSLSPLLAGLVVLEHWYRPAEQYDSRTGQDRDRVSTNNRKKLSTVNS